MELLVPVNDPQGARQTHAPKMRVVSIPPGGNGSTKPPKRALECEFLVENILPTGEYTGPRRCGEWPATKALRCAKHDKRTFEEARELCMGCYATARAETPMTELVYEVLGLKYCRACYEQTLPWTRRSWLKIKRFFRADRKVAACRGVQEAGPPQRVYPWNV